MEVCIRSSNLIQHTGASTFAITHELFIDIGVRELRFSQSNAQTKSGKKASIFAIIRNIIFRTSSSKFLE